MQRGLEGRRVALYVGALDNASGVAVQQALEGAGARVHILSDETAAEDFHGGVYAALVAVANARDTGAPVLQLVREFMASDKPVAALGDAVRLVVEAGGAGGRRMAAASDAAELEGAGATTSSRAIEVDDALITATAAVAPGDFATAVVRAFSERLDDQAVDEMSDLSFPASDPPAVTPTTLGRESGGEAR
jgi:putative intracellular protease/amidase